MLSFVSVAMYALLFEPSELIAQSVPALVNYQGKLVNSNGLPVSTGDYQLRFRIYDAVANGNLIWGPQVFNGQTGPGYGSLVSVVQGWFNVILGPLDANSNRIASAFAGTDRFIEIQVGTNAPFSPRQQILSAPFALRAEEAALAQVAVSASNLLSSPVPSGIIVMWSGLIAQIPAGWALCDGANGTPDLRDRFVVGAGTTFPPGSLGGSSTHSHTAGSYAVPAHSHTIPWAVVNAGGGGNFNYIEEGAGSPNFVKPTSTDESSPLSLTGTSDSVSNIPPFYALAFIMKQ